MTLQIKDKNFFDETKFKTILFNEKIRISRVFLWIKDPDQDPVEPKRPVPTGFGSATLVKNKEIRGSLREFYRNFFLSIDLAMNVDFELGS